MKFRDANPQERTLPETVYAVVAGTPENVLCVCVDLQTATAIQSSCFPAARIVPGSLVDE